MISADDSRTLRAAAPALAGPGEARRPSALRRLLASDALVVVAVAFAAHFLLIGRFGLYEDDYAFVAAPLAWSWEDARAWVVGAFTTLPQGRPISFVLGSIVPFLWFRLGGLDALPLVYLTGAAVVCTNALLAHRLLARTYGRSFGLLGALLFTLYPADTTHPLLTHSLMLQPALTFTLLALLAYRRGWRVVAFLLAAGSLFTYESGLLPFFAAPLLAPTWDRALPRRWAVHVALVLALVVAAVVLRLSVGEERMVEMEGGWGAVPWRVVQAVVIGSGVSLASFAERCLFALRRLGPEHLYPTALAVAALMGVALARRAAGATADVRVLARAGATGLVLLAAGYGLAFTSYHFPPTERAGRLTSVHLGATLGAAIVVAALLSLLWAAARRPPTRVAAAGLVAIFLASLFAFRVVVQRGFARSAEHQRQYWSRLLELVPDLGPGSVVVLLSAEPPASEFILTSSWADTAVLRLLVHPASGPPPQLVGGVVPFEEAFLEARDGELWWSTAAPPWLYVDRQAPLPRDLFVLEREGSGWTRRTGTVVWQGVARDLPPPRAAKVPLEEGPLHPLLVTRRREGAHASR